MAYNKFRWWTKGRPNKPLKTDAPLLLKIRNGDFDYSIGTKIRKTRQIKNFQQNLKINDDLWKLASKYLNN